MIEEPYGSDRPIVLSQTGGLVVDGLRELLAAIQEQNALLKVAQEGKQYEYATTTGLWPSPSSINAPYAPDGDGWELNSSAVVEDAPEEYRLFWFWRRPMRAV